MPTSTITSKGQVTIPKEVREHMRLAPGDRVEFMVEPDGTVKVRAVEHSALALSGFLRWHGEAPTAQELNESIAEGRSRDDSRIRLGR